jgi:peroxiredoxin Q/BCP
MKKVLGLIPLALARACCRSLRLPVQTPAVELKVGDQAPDFTLPATDGKTYTLSKDLKGHWVVLAWFPKAFTAG